jgi:outer membrane cobalamin receptor
MEQVISTKKYSFHLIPIPKAGLLVLVLFICFSCCAFAAGIKVKVTDQVTQMPVANVTVKVSNTPITAVTDAAGICYLDKVPSGKVTIILWAENYKQQVVNLTVTGKTTELNASLERLRINLQEVVIKARVNPRSDQQSRLTEKNTISAIDIASGDLIENTGSISAGDVVQHIQGLSVTRTSTGNTDKAIIRGMEAKYSYTLINGFKIPSPDDKSRYISLDLFPAGLLQSVQVYKSLTADMEGDAIGGVVNMVMRQPPDEPLFQVNLSTGYSGHYFDNQYRTFNSGAVQDHSPYERFGADHYATGADFSKDNLAFYNSKPLPDVNANLLFGREFLNKKLGLIIAADYKNIKTGSDGFFIPLNTQPNLNNVPAFSDFYKHSYSNNKIALSTNEQLVYKPDSANKFTLSHFYLNQKDIESRSTVDTSLILGRSGAGTGRIYVSDRSRVHEQQINNINLKGNHNINSLSIDWAGVFSVADGRYPDWAKLTANTGRLVSPEGTITQSPLYLAPLNRVWLSNKEKDLDVYLDLHYKPGVFNQKLTLSGGGLVRRKNRDNFYNSYTFTPTINEPFTDINSAVWVNDNGPQNPLGNVNNPNNYTAKEHINAFYIMADLQSGRSEFSGGLRLEQTDQNFISTLDPDVSYGKTVNIKYKDWLPDFHWKYTLSDQQQLKASYFKGISRPALYDITFATIAYEDYIVAGNPFLRRTQADNYDFNYTWYQTKSTQFKAALFYKHIVDAYEKTLLNGNDELYPIPQNGLDYTPAGQLTEQFKNTGTAVNYGAELFYSYDWHNFVITGSYTYTSSNITRIKKLLTRENPDDPASNLVTVSKPEKGPLEGQAKHLVNVNLLYKNVPGNWLVNMSLIYTGKHIDLVSPWYNLDYWQRPNVTVNLSAEKKLSSKFKIRLSASNLFNNGITDDILVPNPNGAGNLLPAQTQVNKITVLKQDFSAYYQLGLNYQL